MKVEPTLLADSLLWRRIEEGSRGVKVWSLSNTWIVLPFIKTIKNSREEGRDLDDSTMRPTENWFNCKN